MCINTLKNDPRLLKNTNQGKIMIVHANSSRVHKIYETKNVNMMKYDEFLAKISES